jgi:tripartite-type tricarboxylate transporter receptor subunit TctC
MKPKFFIACYIFSLAVLIFSACSKTNSQSSAKTGEADWPQKTIQIICPFAPGGDTDFNARAYTEHLSKELGVNVVIVTTAGNGGATGARKGKDSPNDGYTVLFSSSAFLTSELSGAIDFGIEEFEFSSICAQGPGLVVCVNKSLGVKTLAELSDYTKANPGKLSMAANTGATTQVVALMLKNAGIDASIVDIGASEERIAALLGGHIDIIINAYGSVKDYFASGEFVALGLTEEDPGAAALIKDIPTCGSQGFKVQFPSYFFFAFPKGTDKAVVDKFTAAVGNVAKNNAAYADAIGKAYYQIPFFAGGTEGLKLFNDTKAAIAVYQNDLSIKK